MVAPTATSTTVPKTGESRWKTSRLLRQYTSTFALIAIGFTAASSAAQSRGPQAQGRAGQGRVRRKGERAKAGLGE